MAATEVADAEELALDEVVVDDVDALASLVWGAEASPLDDPSLADCAGGGPGGGGAFCAMDSRPAASSEDDSSPSPLVSSAENALAKALD